MRIARVQVENFRSIRQLDCQIDDITTFVGPNGSGKSTILRALDWFFNGNRGVLEDDDVHFGASDPRRVRVTVEFTDLSSADRAALGPKYAAQPGSTFTAWRTWEDGEDKLTGKALAFAPFEEIRKFAGAMDKRTSYAKIRAENPDYALPPCKSAPEVEAAMDAWELGHPELLAEAEVSDTHLFGFNGRGKLAELFDFIFVSADFRAGDEAIDTKDSIFGKILQRVLDRSELQEAVTVLTEAFESEYDKLNQQYLATQLQTLGDELTAEMGIYTRARSVALSAALPSIRPQFPRIDVQVSDSVVSTAVDRQGHGLQRTLLVGALTVLSRRSRQTDSPAQMFLAIEEPELFQHPTQARAFASVLRSIATDASQAVQIAYATHSPYFVEPRFFDEVRRVTTCKLSGEVCASTRITTATVESVCKRLDGYIKADSIQRRWDQVCLKYLPEALFAETVILVEGDEDAAILQGLGGHTNELALAGICVAPVSGKNNMMLPFTILRELGIHALMVVDNDSGAEGRMRKLKRDESDIAQAIAKNASDNRMLCRLVGAAEEDFPVGEVSPLLAFIPDTLETLLSSDLPEWDQKRHELIDTGRGVDGKNAATYEIAARECKVKPGEDLSGIMDFVLRKAA
ncbi:ATP-dependent nuclease [Kribbella sp. CA-293567]|uniref:ATP-dependent nuclease n=1 Tax=Kribbella sp. CA-293567 TaxID=3002436 RepID=UPI0022DE2391|nr:AAA family ATPase [Kribbella sp. CA-293567]WBQ01890.1 AAA family ATPase [Kribbella sp. CA-293567]